MPFSRAQERNIKSVVTNSNSIVPLIGDDAFIVETPDGDVTLLSYVVQQLCEEIPELRNVKCESSAEIYYIFTRAKASMDAVRFKDEFREIVDEVRDNGRLRLRESVLDFLAAMKPRLIITTSPFSLIENALSVRGVNYNSFYYSPASVSQGRNKDDISSLGNTVYHIFGKAADGWKWVCDEDSLLEFLHNIQGGDYSCNNLYSSLAEKPGRLMVLGSHLPDWIFRFLWFPFQNQAGEVQKYWLSHTDSNVGFFDFLQCYHFDTDQAVDEILAEITSRIKDRDKMISTESKADCESYDAFISYAGEDYDIAERIYNVLSRKLNNVFFDKEAIKYGENYVNRYIKAIYKSKLYIPVVTENFWSKVFEDSHVKVEVIEAAKRIKSLPEDAVFSLPLVIDGRVWKNGSPLDTKLIEEMAKNFPDISAVFYHINMKVLNPDFSDNDIEICK